MSVTLSFHVLLAVCPSFNLPCCCRCSSPSSSRVFCPIRQSSVEAKVEYSGTGHLPPTNSGLDRIGSRETPKGELVWYSLSFPSHIHTWLFRLPFCLSTLRASWPGRSQERSDRNLATTYPITYVINQQHDVSNTSLLTSL